MTTTLLDQVYDELRAIAGGMLRHRQGQTLQATALVHEAWLRMQGQRTYGDLDRTRFVALAALSIRRILVDSYREKSRLVHGGSWGRVELTDAAGPDGLPDVDLLALDEGLEMLAVAHPRAAQVVELRFFGGLTLEQAAEHLECSPRTATKEFRLARSWLLERLGEQDAP